jgi:retron-type reverse transcriptase
VKELFNSNPLWRLPICAVSTPFKRFGDQRIIRLVRKWLRAGVLEDGELSVSETGTPHGAVASPLFANVYRHYAFDLRANRWRRREAKGNVIIVRYADDIVVGFEYEADARRSAAVRSVSHAVGVTALPCRSATL